MLHYASQRLLQNEARGMLPLTTMLCVDMINNELEGNMKAVTMS